MSHYSFLFISMISLAFTSNALASSEHHSKYSGQEKRLIKSLSQDDINQLKNGKGWGLAKAAELNGVPGPLHLLQMKNEISLSKQQVDKIQNLFNKMKAEATPLGLKLILLEKKLNAAFANNTMTNKILSQQLTAIAKTRKELRYVHLATHLETPKIISADQIAKYNKLRGYGSGDPCKNLPKGHDAEMWKKHNGCK